MVGDCNGSNCKLKHVNESEIGKYRSSEIQDILLEQFIGLAANFRHHIVKEDQAQYNLFDESSEDEN